jgi:hypothetical protein
MADANDDQVTRKREYQREYQRRRRAKYPSKYQEIGRRYYENNTLKVAFRACRNGAHRRGIPFQLTFEEWLSIWRTSGKLAQRGCRKEQYVMARFRDTGPYSPGNVKIIRMEENIAERSLDYLMGKPLSKLIRKKISAANTGKRMIIRNGRRTWANLGDADYPE